MPKVLGDPAFPYTHSHIVVVHGIGDQAPNETALNFMNNFVRALPTDPATGYTVEVDNLIESVDDVRAKAPDGAPARSFRPAFLVLTNRHDRRNYVIGFSEVYWQNITNGYLGNNGGEPPIPIFVWAHSINARMLRQGGDFADYRKTIDNLEKLFGNLRMLAVLLKGSRVLFNILNRFLGDVQMYAESDRIRTEINRRFRNVMARVVTKFTPRIEERFRGCGFTSTSPKVFVVAHSEGTVVAYTSMVEAARTHAPWLKYVAGFVTLGSPLSKHFVIWRNRFKDGRLPRLPDDQRKIAWHNYWDHNDPVGYGLKRLFADPQSDANKLFDLRCDLGFDRYWVPGLAHVRYWDDAAIHRDIIGRLMQIGPAGSGTTVASKWWRPLPPVLDVVAHWGGRVATLAAAAFFLHKLWLVLVKGVIVVHNLACTLPYAGSRLPAWKWDGGPLPAKDAVGYLVGLVFCWLVWRLHTTVHKGLLDMWRATKGTGTGADTVEDRSVDAVK